MLTRARSRRYSALTDVPTQSATFWILAFAGMTAERAGIGGLKAVIRSGEIGNGGRDNRPLKPNATPPLPLHPRNPALAYRA